MGEGGALLIQDEKYVEDAEIIREKGTNRSKFFRGQIDKYTWVEAGSSYLPSDMNAAYLWAQLEKAQEIYDDRMATWNLYYENLLPLQEAGKITLPFVPEDCVHSAHMFYVKAKDLEERSALIRFLKENEISKPVKTQYGWHIIKREALRKSEVKPFAEDKAQLIQYLTSQKEQELMKAYIAKLEKEAKVKILVPRPAPQMMMPGM
jgi:dTDP-4-amino-4,6-dideoxygalactose transaminase